MTTKRIGRASGRRESPARVRLGLATALLLAVCCGGGGAAGQMHRAFDKADYAEVVALGRHALRGGDVSPEVHYYYGLALVAVGRDHEGFGEIDAAVGGDAGLKKKAAEWLRDRAGREGLSRSDAARRLAKAVELDPSIDLGRQRFAVARSCFDEREFARAAALYGQAVKAFPAASECESAYARLVECWTALGNAEKARAAMETLVARYPKGQEAREVTSRLNDLMYNEAHTHFEAGEYEQTIALAQNLVDTSDNRSLQQKGRFLLGQAYEARGDRAAAYNQYRDVIRNDRGDSGQVVERARARIEALQEAGLE